jgi:fructuronate reductase
MVYARDPAIQFGTINAPEGAYGVVYKGGEYATPTSSAVKQDMETGSVISDAGKWTAFARERFHAGLKFALVSCTNFSGNGHVTGATLRTVARAWEDKGFAPKGLVGYLSDPSRFSFPNTMIDRIAVPPDEQTRKVMEKLGIASNIVVTERTRYWVVEDLFPNGRPEFEKAEGVIMEESYEEVKKYEDMKLRILNMAHSVIAGLGVLLGYRGQYGIYRAMQDKDIRKIIDCIICIVSGTIEHPGKMDPAHFAKDTIERLNNANIPDDPMRIAFNGSTKMQPRLMDTYFAGVRRSIPRTELDLVLLGVAGFLRYTVGTDDEGKSYPLEADPIKDVLVACGQKAVIGDPASSVAFRDLISRADVMGRDLYSEGDAGRRMQEIIGKMLAGPSSVRKTLQEYLRNR